MDFLIDPFVAGTSAGDPDTLVVSNASNSLYKSHAWNCKSDFPLISLISIAILAKTLEQKFQTANDLSN